jgi:glycosyltransferase involved in cell wall biosynthesis
MLVSVYIPTKNRLALVKEAIKSVLNQSYPEIELLVVDDGSSDSTPDYLQGLAASDARVKVFLNSLSQGACHCRNTAINAATGDFITGLDDDDEFLPHRIQSFVEYWRFLQAYETTPISCIYTHVIGRTPSSSRRLSKASKTDHNDLMNSNCLGNQVFAPRRHYLEAGGFDEAMPAWQDLEFFFRLLAKFGTARLLDLHTYIFEEDMGRTDRISVGRKDKVMAAYSRMASKHATTALDHQKLLLQVFNNYYNFPITLPDVIHFMQLGWWPRGYKEMLRRYWTRRRTQASPVLR